MKRAKYWMGALLLALVWSGGAMAATCTSKASGNWSSAATWTCVGTPVVTIPGATDTAIIASPNTVTLVGSVPVASLTVIAGGTLADAGFTLTITGNLTNNGTISGGGNMNVTGAASVISGTGTFTNSRLYTSGMSPTIAAGSTLNFTGSSRLYTGRTQGGTTVAASVLTINGTINSTVTTATTTFLRLYATNTIVGSTGVINASVSAVTYNTATATLTNNGSVNVNRITRNAVSNFWTQGVNSSLTVSVVSTVGTLNANANGNTVTYNGTATVITPSVGYWNLAGTIFPGACPHGVTVLGSDPCPVGGPVSVTANPSNCVNVAGIGTLAWGTPANAVSSNNVYTTVSLNDLNVSNYLRCTGYGFAIPAGATINGITVRVERKASTTNNIRDAAMRLVKDVAGVATIQATDRSTLTFYPTADTVEAHGGAADLWGGAWTTADINQANFGAAFASQKPGTAGGARTVTVDHMPITVTYTPAAPLHHIRIEHNGGACSGASSPARITLKACADAACTTMYTAANVTGINLSPTSAGYTWAPANPQTILAASGGINSGNITLARSTAGTASLAITGTPSPAPGNTYECYNSNTGISGDCNLVFSGSTFSFDVLDHTSGSRQVVTLTSCRGSFASTTRSVKFWSTYDDPLTGTLQGKVVAGTGNADCATGYSNLGTSSASPTTLSLAFGTGTTPQATFSLCYPDVGKVKVDNRYDGSAATGDVGTVVLGSDFFIANPAGFTLSNIKRTSDNFANPAAANAAGTAFVKAGEAYTVSVTAVNALGATTPNYGKETVPESVKLTPTLVAGLGLTNNPAVSGSFGAFASGVATGTAFKWDEVGIITLTPSVGDANYLGAGDVTGTTSGNVGRFSLGKFALQNIVFDNRADLCQGGLLVSDGVTACSPAFTYMNEEIDANFTLVPMSLNDAIVQNYVDSAIAANDFAKLDPSTFANLNLAAVDRATAGGPYFLTARISNAAMPVASCATVPCFQSGSAVVTAPFNLSRNVMPDGAYSSVEIGIAPVDSDGARVEGDGATPGLCNNPNAVDCYDLDSDAIAGNDRALLAATEFLYGRMKLTNAHGSELLSLPITATVQYWNGASFVTSIADSETQLDTRLSTAGGNVLAAIVKGSLALGNVSVVTPGLVTFANGVNTFRLGAPTVAGSVDLTIVNAPGYLLPSSTGRATFGVYKGAKEFIYQRENY